ncbi:MAG: hypothetical protein F6K19_01415 [Cyanothece sp. SIO1E1]|nr:hypothetical protein [Cyanothece sp. SIO1E1]
MNSKILENIARFNSIREAFEYFITNIYPNMTAGEKKEYYNYKRNYNRNLIGELKMKEALEKYGASIDVTVEIS